LIIVDTNVISEPTHARPARQVLEWLDAQDPGTLYFTTVGLCEILAGVAILPAGRRRTLLAKSVERLIAEIFGGRILPYDVDAAEAYADVMARTRAVGHNLLFADAQIAAIASTRHWPVATRDVSPFKAAGLDVINPWTT
jgi:predicted nucleic acid-binding protein